MKIKNKIILALAAVFGISLPVLALNQKAVKAEATEPETALYDAVNAADEFTMVGETTLRLDGNGLRFKAKLGENVYNKVDDETTKLYFIIMPESYGEHFKADYSKAIVRDGEGNFDKANSYCLYVNVPKTSIGQYENDEAYYALAGISPVHKNNYTLNFTAIAALETKTADGYSYEYATSAPVANQYDVLLNAVLGENAPYTEIGEYYDWFGGEGHPVKITDNEVYGKLKAKLSETYFNGKYFVFTKEVTDYNAEDFADLGANVTKFYKVTLNANGATSCETLEQYTYGDGAALPVPEKTGYTFGGWYASEDFSGEAVEQILSTDVGDKTYYARWVENVSVSVSGKTKVELHDTNDFTVDFGDKAAEIEGELESVTVDGVAFTTKTYAGGVLTLDTQTLGTATGDRAITAKFVKKTASGATIKVTAVTAYLDVATMFIHNEAELNSWLSVCYDNYGRSGVYKLANDITCAGRYTSIFRWGPSDNPYDGAGFIGTFDGQGYAIYNFFPINGETKCLEGFIGCIATGGTLKNVSFINAKPSISGGTLAGCNRGTIENVYVKISEFIENGKYNWGTSLSTLVNNVQSANIRNVIVEYDCDVPDTALSGYPFSDVYASLPSVYAIGISKMANNTDGVSGAYATYTDLVTAGVNFTSSASEFWAFVNGMPYPKRLSTPDFDPYDLKNKTELAIEFTKGYYLSTSHANIISTDDTANYFKSSVHKFTKEEIPVGSVIWIASGWGYRPEGWINGVNSGTRPTDDNPSYVMVTEEWWGSYTERAFNLYKLNGSNKENITGYDNSTMGNYFKIYVPKNA